MTEALPAVVALALLYTAGLTVGALIVWDWADSVRRESDRRDP